MATIFGAHISYVGAQNVQPMHIYATIGSAPNYLISATNENGANVGVWLKGPDQFRIRDISTANGLIDLGTFEIEYSLAPEAFRVSFDYDDDVNGSVLMIEGFPGVIALRSDGLERRYYNLGHGNILTKSRSGRCAMSTHWRIMVGPETKRQTLIEIDVTPVAKAG